MRSRGLGLGRGDALALMSTNSIEFLAIYYACAKLGLVCVPINLFWRHKELGYVLVARARESGRGRERADRAIADRARRGARACATSSSSASAAAADGRRPARARVRRAVAARRRTSRERWSRIATRSPISTPAAPPRRRRASSAAISRSTSNRLAPRSTRGMSANDRMTALMPLFHTAQLNAFVTPADRGRRGALHSEGLRRRPVARPDRDRAADADCSRCR